MRKLLIACLITLPATLSGCNGLFNTIAQGLAVSQLTFGFDKVELQKADIPFITPNAKADLLITLTANNPNPVKASLDQIGFDLLMDGTKVGVGSLNNGLSVEPKGTAPFSVLVSIPYAGLPTAAMTALQNRKTQMTLRGMSNISTPIGNIAVPLELSKSVTF